MLQQQTCFSSIYDDNLTKYHDSWNSSLENSTFNLKYYLHNSQKLKKWE